MLAPKLAPDPQYPPGVRSTVRCWGSWSSVTSNTTITTITTTTAHFDTCRAHLGMSAYCFFPLHRHDPDRLLGRPHHGNHASFLALFLPFFSSARFHNFLVRLRDLI
jgi:hypothetical protein